VNIGEASDVATILQAITYGGDHAGPFDAERIELAMERLNQRAAKALQLTVIVPMDDVEIAARELAQRAADRA
jgi:hypothetical protein